MTDSTVTITFIGGTEETITGESIPTPAEIIALSKARDIIEIDGKIYFASNILSFEYS